jgi:hypothetical protein
MNTALTNALVSSYLSLSVRIKHLKREWARFVSVKSVSLFLNVPNSQFEILKYNTCHGRYYPKFNLTIIQRIPTLFILNTHTTLKAIQKLGIREAWSYYSQYGTKLNKEFVKYMEMDEK